MNSRQIQILQLVQENGLVDIAKLADIFDMTAQSIRRDVNDLCQQGLLRRVHGGVTLPSSIENSPYDTRNQDNLNAKSKIGFLVAEHIPNNVSLFINIGTTTEAVARALLNHKGLTVITNNLNVAVILSKKADFNVIIAGGSVRGKDMGVVGEATIDFIRQFKVDFGIIGISAIDEEGKLYDFDYREIKVSQTIIEQSKRVWLVTDNTKFGKDALAKLGSFKDIDSLFTDQMPDKKYQAKLHAAKVTIFTP
ncbi:transcriptional repressor GlpR [Gammaproteobacteria bacterium]|nr:transcriptional repressor GlpR [Gammaproteobacteria bacterium]